MKQKKQTYILGHRNPDTDSVVSAIAYADLKKLQGASECYPVRVGKINPQTDYILRRFDVEKPRLISDLVPRVRNYMSISPLTVHESTPLWEALEILNRDNHKMLPVVDDSKRLTSVLHYNAFAQNMLKKIDPHRQNIIPTTITMLSQTLNAQEIITFHGDEVFKARLLVAASDLETISEFIDSIPGENIIIIAGNRAEVHRAAIERGIRCLVVTGGKTIRKDVRELAEKKKTSLLISPFDTATSSLLSFYATPVKFMADNALEPLGEDQYIKNIHEKISASISRSLPVVDAEKRVIGILSQGDLMGEPNIDVILVDHNELSQAAEGIKNYRILEIIDHHRLGNPPTTYPITFINKPVGSTSTIIATLFLEQKIPMQKNIASLLLAGILSDTLILRSATTTDTDRNVAQYLAEITDLSIEEFGNDIMHAASQIGKKPVNEILAMDMKRYPQGDTSYSVSQVEVTTLTELMERQDKILEELNKLQKSENFLFSALLVTDITELDSIFFIAGDEEVKASLTYPKIQKDIYSMKGILSRKKQLIPYLTEVISRSS